jgi:hypothetical protein
MPKGQKGTMYDATKRRTQSCPNMSVYTSVPCISEGHGFPLALTQSLCLLSHVLPCEHCILNSAALVYNKHVSSTKMTHSQGTIEVEAGRGNKTALTQPGLKKGDLKGWGGPWLATQVAYQTCKIISYRSTNLTLIPALIRKAHR